MSLNQQSISNLSAPFPTAVQSGVDVSLNRGRPCALFNQTLKTHINLRWFLLNSESEDHFAAANVF